MTSVTPLRYIADEHSGRFRCISLYGSRDRRETLASDLRVRPGVARASSKRLRTLEISLESCRDSEQSSSAKLARSALSYILAAYTYRVETPSPRGIYTCELRLLHAGTAKGLTTRDRDTYA